MNHHRDNKCRARWLNHATSAWQIVARGNAGEERACGTRERRRQPPWCAALAWNRTQPRQRRALLLRRAAAAGALRLHRTTVEPHHEPPPR
ncbi:hypothetical protein [Halomonas sp.]|uniref:hypothetical protein n=1 Tax=unclassified Halomonas TaxID=2609666 RepID=UPI003F93E706